jgi:hypothetical protein
MGRRQYLRPEWKAPNRPSGRLQHGPGSRRPPARDGPRRLARWGGVLTEERTEALTAYAFFVALPALAFVSTFDRKPAELVSPALLAGLWVTLAVAVGLAWLVHRRERDPARRSVAVVQSYHSNFGYIGLPIVTATLGDGRRPGKRRPRLRRTVLIAASIPRRPPVVTHS